MFALLVRFIEISDHLEASDRLVDETLTEVAIHEPGNLVYLNHQWVDHPDERVFYECYQSKDDFEAHEAEMHTRRFLDERGQHFAQPAEVWWLDTLEGVIRVENRCEMRRAAS